MELIKPYTFDLDSHHKVLVVLDMQNATCIYHAGYGKALADAGEPDAQRAFFERVEKIVIPRQQQLPDYFRDNCLRVVFTASGCLAEDCMDVPPHRTVRHRFRRQYAGSPEYETIEAVRPLPGEVVINKGTVSVFVSTGLDSMMRSWGACAALFTGVLIEVCVGGAARHAADLGYDSLIVEDCCGTTDAALHATELRTFGRLFGRVEPTASVIEELERSRARRARPHAPKITRS